MVTGLGFQYCHLSSPLYGLMANRYRMGSAVTPAPGGRVLHPHGHSVVMVQSACALFNQARDFDCSRILSHFSRNESHDGIVTVAGKLSGFESFYGLFTGYRKLYQGECMRRINI
jgi:hypothetical protein